jgi:hypothetical protein
VWCGWASAFHRTSVLAELTWLGSLAIVVVAGVGLRRAVCRPASVWHLAPASRPWPRPGRGGWERSLQGTALWWLLLALAATWDVLGLDSGPHQYHLTLSALSQAYRPLGAGLLLVWILVGIGYQAARARRPLPRPPHSGNEDAAPRLPAVAFGAGGGVTHGVAPGLLLPPHPGIGVAFWLTVPVAAVGIDLLARRSGGRVPTAEELVRFVSTSPAVNLACLAAWTLAGYHLFAR